MALIVCAEGRSRHGCIERQGSGSHQVIGDIGCLLLGEFNLGESAAC